MTTASEYRAYAEYAKQQAAFTQKASSGASVHDEAVKMFEFYAALCIERAEQMERAEQDIREAAKAFADKYDYRDFIDGLRDEEDEKEEKGTLGYAMEQAYLASHTAATAQMQAKVDAANARVKELEK